MRTAELKAFLKFVAYGLQKSRPTNSIDRFKICFHCAYRFRPIKYSVLSLMISLAKFFNGIQNKIVYLKIFTMKPTLSTMLIAGALIIIGLNACTKQDYAPIPGTSTQQAQQAKVDMVATAWTIHDGGIYTSTFQNILANLPITNGSRVSVYAQDGGQSILISGSAVIYKGHPLWASTTRYDVTVGYSCPESPMPFQALHIQVVVN